MTIQEAETNIELDRLQTYSRSNGETAALRMAADEIVKLRYKLADARQAAWPPDSVQEALNSGDGTYRP